MPSPRRAVPLKTNAARLLDTLGIAYEIRSAAVDESDLSAAAMARSLNVPAEQVFKTLVARGSGVSGPEVLMACIPGTEDLDLKKLDAVSGCKSVAMAPLREVLLLTGYVRGGCSPLAAKNNYPVFVDESAVLWDAVYVSAGLRGVQLLLAPGDLLRAVSGRYAALCRE